MSVPISKSLNSTVVSLKSSGGKLMGLQAFGVAAGYIQLFDAAKPSDVTLGTTLPTLSFGVAINGQINMPPGQFGWDFTLGIQAASATTRTGNTTATIDANFFIDVP